MLERAGRDFIRILRGASYKPTDEQVYKIIQLIQMHSEVSIENLIMLSDTFSESEKKIAPSKKNSIIKNKNQPQVSFGRTVKIEGSKVKFGK